MEAPYLRRRGLGEVSRIAPSLRRRGLGEVEYQHMSNERHPHLLRADDTLLLVIDLQEPFLRGICGRDGILTNSRLLIESAEILDVPILATVQYREKMGGLVPSLTQSLPESCAPIDKLCFSCAGDSEFSRALADSGRRQVLICG